MGDVIIFIEDTDKNPSYSRCRICHEEEEEAERYLEAPCSCSGTVKFAHRDCIQRWCDEKGNTICEICLQGYKPGYTTTSKPSRLVEEAVTTRTRRQYRGRRIIRLVDRTESDFPECNSDADRGASCCRYLALLLHFLFKLQRNCSPLYLVQPLLPLLLLETFTALQEQVQDDFTSSQQLHHFLADFFSLDPARTIFVSSSSSRVATSIDFNPWLQKEQLFTYLYGTCPVMRFPWLLPSSLFPPSAWIFLYDQPIHSKK